MTHFMRLSGTSRIRRNYGVHRLFTITVGEEISESHSLFGPVEKVNEKIGKNRLPDPLSKVLSGGLSIASLKLSGGIETTVGIKLVDLSYFTSNISIRASYLFSRISWKFALLRY